MKEVFGLDKIKLLMKNIYKIKMNILLASEFFVVKESLEKLLDNILHRPQVLSISDLTKTDIEEIIDLDFIFTDIKEKVSMDLQKEKKKYY